MDFSVVHREANNSPFAQQLKDGFSNLRFLDPLEKDFREAYLGQTLRWRRLSGLVALLLILGLTAIDYLFGAADGANGLNMSRLGALCLLLVIALLASFHPSAARHWDKFAAGTITLIGFVMVFVSVKASLAGVSYLFGGLLLLMVYNFLFLGLLFNTAVTISVLMLIGYFGVGYALGLPQLELFYKTAILGASVVIGAVGTYTLEHSLRTSFLEARLLNQLAERDGLTGLYNRRIFDDYIDRIWRQSRRENSLLQMIFIDIDYFKIYNDLYGHQAGDDCLKRVASTIAKSAKRPFDFCARYGGEEFVLVVYRPPRDYAKRLPEEIRRDVAELEIPHRGSDVSANVTVSIGVAMATPNEGRSLAGVIQIADEALYQVKEDGRNRVVVKETQDAFIETGTFRARVDIRERIQA